MSVCLTEQETGVVNLPEILRAWRGEATQREAARHLGVAYVTYFKWEQGQRPPSASTMSLLLDKLKRSTPVGG